MLEKWTWNINQTSVQYPGGWDRSLQTIVTERVFGSAEPGTHLGFADASGRFDVFFLGHPLASDSEIGEIFAPPRTRGHLKSPQVYRGIVLGS